MIQADVAATKEKIREIGERRRKLIRKRLRPGQQVQYAHEFLTIIEKPPKLALRPTIL